MSSLVPGSLFISTGLNRNHTPTPAFITNDELQERYSRAAFNGRPWPPSSPVAGVYDIRNSSTQLILLNNRKKKESQLRGRSNPRKEEHRYPSPERHSRCSTPVNREYHTQCLDSSSPYYEPETDLDMDWLTRSERPPNRFAAGSAVNPKRHTSCQVPTNPRAFDIRLHSPRRPNSRTSLPASFGGGASMGFNEMTPGEQRYFASISRIYSNNQMVRLKRRQYIDLLNQELTKGLYTKKEYERYRDYISLGRQRQYIKVQGRATSAPVRRIAYSDTDTNRSFTSNAEDDKSSVTDSNTKTSTTTTNTDTTPKQKTKRTKSSDTKSSDTKSSDKRTPSATSTASRKSGGKISQQSRSRSASAKSTVSTKSSGSVKPKETKEETPQQREQKEEEPGKDETKSGDNSVKENDEERKKKKEGETSDSDTNLPSEKQYSAREGHDRPKSRLGHIPEDGDQSDQTESKEDKYIDNEIKKEFKEDTTNDTQEQTSTQNGDAQKRSNDDDENYEQKKTSDEHLREQKKSSDEQYHVQKRSDDDDDDNVPKRSIDGDNVQKQSRDDDDKVQKRRSRDSSDSESDEERQTRDPEKLPY